MERSDADPPDREIDTFTCESSAYRRLKENGVCQQGVVPDFYGVIEQIDPTLPHWQQHLRKFLNDKLRPNAVLMEYIPNMRQIDLSTFSEATVTRLPAIVREIHRVGVYHGDMYPRNMMVQEGSHRVLLIDFDRAQTLSVDLGLSTLRQRQLMEREERMINWFIENLVSAVHT